MFLREIEGEKSSTNKINFCHYTFEKKKWKNVWHIFISISAMVMRLNARLENKREYFRN